MSGPRRFEAGQQALLPAVLDRAEEVVGDRFHVASFRDSQYAYDVRTRDDLGPDEVPAGSALATIVRYGRDREPRKLSRFHRICLHDGRILACAEDEDLPLQAVLLVVLVHELIHLVRFTVPHTTFHVPATQRRDEEAEVDRLTAELLGDYPEPDVRRAARLVTGLAPLPSS